MTSREAVAFLALAWVSTAALGVLCVCVWVALTRAAPGDGADALARAVHAAGRAALWAGVILSAAVPVGVGLAVGALAARAALDGLR